MLCWWWDAPAHTTGVCAKLVAAQTSPWCVPARTLLHCSLFANRSAAPVLTVLPLLMLPLCFVRSYVQAVVQQALSRLMAGRTVLVIAHRLSTIRDADRICVISGGQLAEQGSHEELTASKGLYAGLIARQLAASGSSSGGSEGLAGSQAALSCGSFSSRAAGGSMSDLSEGVSRPGLQEGGRGSMSSSRGSTSRERSSTEAEVVAADGPGSSSSSPAPAGAAGSSSHK